MDIFTPLTDAAALADFALRASLVVAAAGLAHLALRRGAAATRHTVWLMAVVLLAVLLPAAALLPQLSLPLLPAGAPVGVAPAEATPPEFEPTPVVAPAAAAVTPAVPIGPVEVAPEAGQVEAANRWSWGAGLVALWAVGVLCVLGIAGLGFLRLARLRRRAERVDDPAWQEAFAAVKGQVAVRGEVSLLRSSEVDVAVTWGLRRAYVCLPSGADGWSDAQRRLVLAHELMHVRRGDWLWQLLSTATVAVHWFNPLVWWAVRHLRVEAETACDDAVLERGYGAVDYADCLCQMVCAARGSQPLRVPAMPMAARPSELSRRLAAILDGGIRRRDVRLGTLMGGAAVAAVAGSLLAASQLVPARAADGDSAGGGAGDSGAAPKRTPEQMVEALRSYYEGRDGDRAPQVEFRDGGIWLRRGRVSSRYSSTRLIPGDPAPTIECAGWLNSEGAPDTEGKVVMVDFSATWCGPCVRSMPHVQAIHEKYADRGLLTVIATNEAGEVFAPFAKKNGLTMPVALETTKGCIREGFGVQGWPTLFLIDRAGKVAYVGDPRDEGLEETIVDLLEGRAPEGGEKKGGGRVEERRAEREVAIDEAAIEKVIAALDPEEKERLERYQAYLDREAKGEFRVVGPARKDGEARHQEAFHVVRADTGGVVMGSSASRTLVPGDRAPDLHHDGVKWSNTAGVDVPPDTEGKVVLGIHCNEIGKVGRRMLKLAQDLHRQYADKGLVVVGLAGSDDGGVSDDWELPAASGYSPGSFHEWGMLFYPVVTMIDREGKIAHCSHYYAHPSRENYPFNMWSGDIEREIERLLGVADR